MPEPNLDELLRKWAEAEAAIDIGRDCPPLSILWYHQTEGQELAQHAEHVATCPRCQKRLDFIRTELAKAHGLRAVGPDRREYPIPAGRSGADTPPGVADERTDIPSPQGVADGLADAGAPHVAPPLVGGAGYSIPSRGGGRTRRLPLFKLGALAAAASIALVFFIWPGAESRSFDAEIALFAEHAYLPFGVSSLRSDPGTSHQTERNQTEPRPSGSGRNQTKPRPSGSGRNQTKPRPSGSERNQTEPRPSGSGRNQTEPRPSGSGRNQTKPRPSGS
ncbi:MAG: hypothetical protein V3W34_02985, partial [Phycisphaerae bacterium]